VQLFETGDEVLAVGVWLLGACGRCLTQARLPARRTKNRWRWKIRHLLEALKPPPTTPHTALSLLTHTLFSPPAFDFLPKKTNLFHAKIIQEHLLYCSHKVSCLKEIQLLKKKKKEQRCWRMRMSDIFCSQWERGGVLWVICRYEFLFTWMEPADGRVGLRPLQGKDSRKPRKWTHFLKHSLARLF